MWTFGTFCDEFYVASRLFFKLDLNPSREALLHFCEQVRRTFPSMTRFRRREDGVMILDEQQQQQNGRRYLRLDTQALRLGHIDPSSRSAVSTFAEMILSHAPCHLSLSDLDYDYLEVVYGFDLEYAGNHDELLAETLLGDNPLSAALLGDDYRVIDCQPCLGVALSEDCGIQAYLEARARTSMQELRSAEYETQLLSIYLTMRCDFRDGAPGELCAVHRDLLRKGEEICTNRVVPQIVLRLREAIASRK